MVKRVLTGAGFVENETFRETRFVKPPRTTYAVYMDSFTRRGADGLNLIKELDCIVVLYSYAPDPAAGSRIETSLDAFGLEFEKDETTWIQEEQLYMTVYRFSHIEKQGV